jgi:hypothetical protein
MGFKAPGRRTVTLPFTGEIEGLVVTVRRASQSSLRAAAELVELTDGPDITELIRKGKAVRRGPHGCAALARRW